MKDQIQEPEEINGHTQSATVIPADQDMLTEEPVIDRTNASANASGPTVSEWSAPAYEPGAEFDEEIEPEKPSDHPLANPGVKDTPPHIKEKGADFLADKILKGYGKLKKSLASWIIPISEKKIDKLEEQGVVDRNIVLPMRDGGSISAGDLIQKHNDLADQIIDDNCLRQEFYDEAKPMLVEELSKRDIALTNMQQLAAVTAIDMYSFGEALKPLWEQKQDIINAFKDATAAYREMRQSNFNSGQQQQPGPGNSQEFNNSAPPVTPAPPVQPVQPDGNNGSPTMMEVVPPGDMLEAIQNQRGSGSPVPPQVFGTANTKKNSLRVKKPGGVKKGPRGPYKKRAPKVEIIP